MTELKLAELAGALISLAFSYIPGLSDWYTVLDGMKKRLIMLLALALVAGGVYALSCIGQSAYFTCDIPGIWQAVTIFVHAAIANQATYLIAPRSQSDGHPQG